VICDDPTHNYRLSNKR